MKKLKKWIFPTFLLMGTVTLVSWYFWDPVPTLTVTPSGSDCVITLSNLPALTSTSPKARYKVFFNTNDGHHYLRETDPLNPTAPVSIVHKYQAGNYSPYVEYTEMEYDDDRDNPPLRIATTYNPGSNTGTPSSELILTDRILNIEAVRNIVPDHEITFVVTCKNPCTTTIATGTLTFEYDGDVLVPVSTQVEVPYMGSSVDQVVSATSQVTITVNNLMPNEQRNYYLRLKTIPEPYIVLNQQLTPVPKVKFTVTGMPNDAKDICGFSNVYELTSLSHVTNAHDPNQKTVELTGPSNDRRLEYTIHFQNDGNAPVKEISITDELSPLLHCVNSLSAMDDFTCSPAGTVKLEPTNDGVDNGIIKVQLQLAGDGLHGTHEPGYGTSISENDTKGYLKIRIPFNAGNNTCPGALPPCGAILNRASIRFGCNPPLETCLATYNLDCDIDANADSIPDSCITTIIIIDSIVSPGFPFLPPQPLLDGYTDAQCKWYPVSGLNLTNVKNPILTELKNKTYTLVASKSCERLIIHRTVRVPCNLAISEPITIVKTGSKFNITANVTGNTGPIEWQDCSDGTSSTHSDVGAGTYYFSVYEPSTGCWVEKWVTTLKVTDDPNDCEANLIVENGVPPYTYLWSYTEQGSTGYSTQNPPLSLGNKSDVSVTVTDSMGNTVVFQPDKLCKTPIPTWTWIVLASIVLGLFVYFGLKKTNIAGP